MLAAWSGLFNRIHTMVLATFAMAGLGLAAHAATDHGQVLVGPSPAGESPQARTRSRGNVNYRK